MTGAKGKIRVRESDRYRCANCATLGEYERIPTSDSRVSPFRTSSGRSEQLLILLAKKQPVSAKPGTAHPRVFFST
jgi:hypothetical protein